MKYSGTEEMPSWLASCMSGAGCIGCSSLSSSGSSCSLSTRRLTASFSLVNNADDHGERRETHTIGMGQISGGAQRKGEWREGKYCAGSNNNTTEIQDSRNLASDSTFRVSAMQLARGTLPGPRLQQDGSTSCQSSQ